MEERIPRGLWESPKQPWLLLWGREERVRLVTACAVSLGSERSLDTGKTSRVIKEIPELKSRGEGLGACGFGLHGRCMTVEKWFILAGDDESMELQSFHSPSRAKPRLPVIRGSPWTRCPCLIDIL